MAAPPHGAPARRWGLRALRLPFRGQSERAYRYAEIPEGAPSLVSRRRNVLYRRALGAADLVSATAALLVGVPLLGQDAISPAAFLAVPMVLLVSKLASLYDRDEHLLRKTTLDEAPALFRVATLYTLLTWLAGDLIVQGTFGREQAVGLWILLFASMLVTRAAARRLARAVSVEERCLVLGDAGAGEWMESKLCAGSGLNARLVGRVSLEGESNHSCGVPVLGEMQMLGLVLAQHDVERVILAPSTADSEQILDAIRLVKSLGIKVSVLPRLFEVVGSSVEFDEIDGVTLLGVRGYGLSRSSRLVKRGLDLVGSVLGLIVIAPLLAMIAVSIKIDSRGPILFRQRRMGSGNLSFEMLKFRTMVDGADAQKQTLRDQNEAGGGLFKIQHDPRITRVGCFLRKTSLDELPQLFNVLRGDMALVGPRPLVVDEDRRIEGWQRRRLLLPPGMTGLWQVFGSARIPLHEMVKIDYLYGANWSLWLDIKILLRTIPFVVGRRGL